jgi:hypothetical protein
MIQEQKGTIDKHVKKLVDHEFTITRQAERSFCVHFLDQDMAHCEIEGLCALNIVLDHQV